LEQHSGLFTQQIHSLPGFVQLSLSFDEQHTFMYELHISDLSQQTLEVVQQDFSVLLMQQPDLSMQQVHSLSGLRQQDLSVDVQHSLLLEQIFCGLVQLIWLLQQVSFTLLE